MRKSAAYRWTINDKDDLDALTAHEHFSGLTLNEAESLFQAGGHFYEEDLWAMPVEAFIFYLPAFTNYLLSNSSKGDADSASAFIDLIKYNTEHSPCKLSENLSNIKKTLNHIAHNQEKYDAPVDIYGNFHNRIGSFQSSINA